MVHVSLHKTHLIFQFSFTEQDCKLNEDFFNEVCRLMGEEGFECRKFFSYFLVEFLPTE